MIYLIQGEHANHYTTDAVVKFFNSEWQIISVPFSKS
jgi:hypothetical protein